MNQKTKVLFVARKFPPSTGGMERFAHDLYSYVSKITNTTLIKWGGSNKWLPIVLPIFFVRSIWELLVNSYDIIHMQDGVLSPMGVALKAIFRKPLVVVIHGLDVTYENSFYQKIVPWALKHADTIICISQAAADEVVKRGINSRDVTVIPLGITDDLKSNSKKARANLNKKFDIDPKTDVLVTVGRLVKRKGVAWFIENVLPELVKKNKDIVYLVIGEGADKENTEAAIKKSGMEAHVRMLGRVGDDDLKNAYNGSDIFMMPNIPVEGDMEGFGRVLLEASLCELPVVATGIEGIKDAIIDNENGYLVESYDIKGFTKRVNSLLDDPKAANVFAKKSREYSLKHYSWETVADQYNDEYQKLLKEG